MYFSLLIPTPGLEREAAHQRLSDDAYGDHQWLWRLFPAPAGTARDFLFRRQESDGLPRYHLVSKRPPVSPGPAWRLQTRAYTPQLEAGERLAFELRASPTVRRGHDAADGKARRHDVVMQAKRQLLAARGLNHWHEWTSPDRPALYTVVQQACSTWLQRRAQGLGFTLDTAQCLVSAYQQHGRSAAATDGRGLQFSSVDFCGELVVEDPAKFQQTLMNGIGSAKAFGCGLLVVRRLV
jgi:CRISPR system Cascade subunit CasE